MLKGANCKRAYLEDGDQDDGEDGEDNKRTAHLNTFPISLRPLGTISLMFSIKVSEIRFPTTIMEAMWSTKWIAFVVIAVMCLLLIMLLLCM